jgi:8-amino-7-oxononanoate synthase
MMTLLNERCKPFAEYIAHARELGFYPYFRPISQSWGPEVQVGAQRLVMVGSNDYLGLAHDPRVVESSERALKRWGTGPGGSRFLCGNLSLHESLEEKLADFVGKRKAIVHTTGFTTNVGAIACLLGRQDTILCDRQSHASIFEGCRTSGARVLPFKHNDAEDAKRKLVRARERDYQGCVLLVTEGVFSMSGDGVPLPDFLALKGEFPSLLFYLDDAHGLGVMGPNGRGTAARFEAAGQVDFIMGTFSKALASIGGFIASDDEAVLEYVRHHSKPLIFSAALPASAVAAAQASLDVLEEEPERVERLRSITRRVRAGYREIGLRVRDSETPIIPIQVGSEMNAYHFARDLFEHGVFALPAVYPAVPKGQAVIRTAYMSTHEDRHIEFVLEVISKLACKYHLHSPELEGQETGMDAACVSLAAC